MGKINLPTGLEVIEPSERHAGAILIADAASNDIAEFFHAEHATVAQTYEQALALARVSAAAPDLLEALRYLVMHCKGLDRFEGNPINEAIRAAREQIAKAEGRP